VAIGLKTGFCLLDSEDLKLIYNYSKAVPVGQIAGGGVGIVEPTYTSGVVALTGFEEQGEFSSRRLTLFSTDSNSALCERTFLFKLESVRLNHSTYARESQVAL
jgi:hypothetical protein